MKILIKFSFRSMENSIFLSFSIALLLILYFLSHFFLKISLFSFLTKKNKTYPSKIEVIRDIQTNYSENLDYRLLEYIFLKARKYSINCRK
jgi:hypothetical protein